MEHLSIEQIQQKQIVRWEVKRVDYETLRYALRTEPKGQGLEVGAYTRWDNDLSHRASVFTHATIEEKAISLGYEIGEDEWNDLVDYGN